jgi:thioredoxin 2
MASTASLVACAHCGALNRVPSERLRDDPVCGACKRALLDGEPVLLDDENFERFVQRTQLPLVVDFWAPWCGPCRTMSPSFRDAARRMKGRAVFVKVNSDDSPKTAQRFGIRSIPTLVRLEQGYERRRQIGGQTVAQLVELAT